MMIRPMASDDAAAVAALCGQLGYPASAAQVVHRLSLLQGDPEHALFVAQTEAGQVVGWVHVHAVRLMEANPRAEIWGLVVDAAHRGQGAGRALMERAEAWAAEHGHRAVRLRSNVVRGQAHQFYQRLGYQITKTSYTFDKPLDAHPQAPAARPTPE
jgi:GNAT superfamily N-acetyltransferase